MGSKSADDRVGQTPYSPTKALHRVGKLLCVLHIQLDDVSRCKQKFIVVTERERERLQCFSQPASLITYRRRQRSNVENIKTVQNELENLHMILLCKKGSHGVCVRGKQRSIPLPNCLESWTLKNHVQVICNSHTTTMCADPIGSGNMLTPSKTPENDWQLMRAQPKL